MQQLHVTRELNNYYLNGGIRAAAGRILITGIAVFLAVMIVPGLEMDSLPAGIAAMLVLTFLNVLVRPILFVLTLPLIVLSLGLFLIVVNALLLEFTAYLVKGFTVAGFWPAVGGAVVISLVTTILNATTSGPRLPEPQQTFQQRPPKIINPEE
ncbi:MAG: phage holin family protein [Nitrospirota bacterium]|jgi:putative membrane protein|nr:phage holin family protein [Nitrospirota bacterium]